MNEGVLDKYQAITLLFAPTNQFVEAHIVLLTDELLEWGILDGWWNDASLKEEFEIQPIDRHWNWSDLGIEFEGIPLESVKYAVETGDKVIQGAMMISVEPVASILEPGKKSLFLELLFTAPQNRPALREDGREYFKGVGTELLRWSALLSREKGYEGRIRLDGSPEYLHWYERKGLQRLDLPPIVFEEVEYTPMELSSEAALKLFMQPPEKAGEGSSK
jgi:hypothetical protein